jgi:IS30 family transposase
MMSVVRSPSVGRGHGEREQVTVDIGNVAVVSASITFDQGSEWSNWQTIATSYGIDCWFCEPHSPWQRARSGTSTASGGDGSPRGTDLAGIDPDHADHVAGIINGQHRRSLDYHSPASLYAAATVQ